MSTVRSQKPMRFSKTDAPGFVAGRGLTGRPRALPERLFRADCPPLDKPQLLGQNRRN